MAQDTLIVVDDPEGEFWEGSLVSRLEAASLKARGVAMLPVNPDLFRMSGVGGYARRAWGSGWPIGTATPRFSAPLTLFCPTGHSRGAGAIHWCARIMIDGDERDGFVRLSSDSGQSNPHRLGVADAEPVDFRALGACDELGGWTVGGRARVNVPADAHYGLALYGHASGARVVWVAASFVVEEG